jgi:hypothetical protein
VQELFGPAQEQTEVVAGSGKYRIDTVAVASLDMVATHPTMADHGLDGGTTTHFAADGVGNIPDLAADPDPEPVGIVVAP